MGGSFRSASLDDLLAQAGWLRRLARQLLKDGSDGEDLTQETWVATLQHPPQGGRPLRPWLAEVMRNVVRMRMRGERRRRAREQATGADGAVSRSTSEELLARLQGQRLIAELVMALEEPYRSTVLLRFYEEKPPREIARLQGIEVVTVRWRLKQALERLRAELARRGEGGQGGWLAVVAPLAQAYPGRPLLKGGLAMAANTKGPVAIVGLVALLALLVGSWFLGRRISSESKSTLVEGQVADRGARSPRFLAPAPTSGAAETGALEVRVVDPAGAPVASAFVAVSRALGGTLSPLAAFASPICPRAATRWRPARPGPGWRLPWRWRSRSLPAASGPCGSCFRARGTSSAAPSWTAGWVPSPGPA